MNKCLLSVLAIVLLLPVSGITQDFATLTMNEIESGTMVARIDEQPGKYNPLPNLDTKVDIKIDGMVASVTVNQMFTNNSDKPIEAIYVFPLPNEASVYEMKMIIGNRIIEGIIKERQEAKEIYQEAKAAGKRASLTEQERPNIFTNSVANIMPGDKILVRLKYVEKVDYEDGVFGLRFPTTVGPRYIACKSITGYSGTGFSFDTDQVPDVSRITPPIAKPGERTGNDISINIELDAGLPLEKIACSSHKIITTKNGKGKYSISLKNKTSIPNCDFIFEYAVAKSYKPQAALFMSPDGEDNTFMLMAIPPTIKTDTIRQSKELILVLDRSGSMDGARMEQAKQGVLNAINRLHHDDYFNIIEFDNAHTMFNDYSVQATNENVQNASQWVRKIDSRGGTEMQSALKLALKQPTQKEKMRIVTLITDGYVGNEVTLYRLIHDHLGKARLFTIAIGDAPNSALMEKISTQGRGSFVYIGSTNDVSSKMDKLFSYLENPALTDLQFSCIATKDIMPNPIPDLFATQPVVIFGKLTNKNITTATLTGKIGTDFFKQDIVIDPRDSSISKGITKMWAHEKLKIMINDFDLGVEDLRQQIIDTSIKYSVLTKLTAFVAVEDIIVNPDGNPVKAIIPNELPKDMDYETFFGKKHLKATEINPPDPSKPVMPKTASPIGNLLLTGLLLVISGAIILKRSRFYHETN
jgi:Ca-activated chloride channel homolog